MRRAYAVLEVKGIDEERRTITGVATTPTADIHGDVIEPLGVQFTNPLPLLLHHDKTKPVGTAFFDPPTKDGITFRATLPAIGEKGAVKDRVDEAWISLKSGLIRGASIGYRPLDGFIERIKATGGFRFLKTIVAELSLVTIPANADATVLTVKQFDTAAPGQDPPGDTGTLPIVRATKGAPPMKQTTAEQITAFTNTRAEKAARMVALMEAAGDESKTLETKESEEYDGLELEIKSIDSHLERLRNLEKLQVAAATPITKAAGNGTEAAAAARSGVISVKSNLPPGTAFVRGCMAILEAKGDSFRALEIARRKWAATCPEVELMVKAAVAPGTTTDPVWAGALVTVQNVTNEFLELLRPATILGKIPNLRMVPFNASVPVQTAGGTYGWVGQAKPKPVTKLGFGTAALTFSKAAGIIVLTEELVKLSSPSAEAIVRADMIAGIAAFLDQQFIDPAVAAVAGVSPASITNGLTPIATTGDPLGDLHALVAALSAANVPLAGLVIIMSETNAFTLGLLRDASGNRMFPNMGATGGTMDGVTVIASNQANGWVIAVQPSAVLVADDGGVSIDVSREATIEMDSAPTDPATTMTSLWQNNLVGLRAERMINWKRGRDVAVQIVTGAAYAPAIVNPGP